MDRCTTCNGFKRISPLGGIEKNCPTCKGVGFVDNLIDNQPVITSSLELVNMPIVNDSPPIELNKPIESNAKDILKHKLTKGRAKKAIAS